MSSVPPPNAPPRMSFAEVAKAANKPVMSKEKLATQTRQNHTSPQIENSNQMVSSTSNLETGVSNPVKDSDQLEKMMEAVNLQPGSLVKRDTSDTKSVTSRTTGVLDEKESLRPDDSASMQAATEEDACTPSESVVEETYPLSHPDVHAFRDQLQEINSTESKHLIPNDVPVVRIGQQSNGVSNLAPPAPVVVSNQSYATRAVATHEMLILPPDDKLKDALASPKDRLFVLKIEQDMIDFIKDSKEMELQLPQTNSFYRMLSHKLAEYYFLGHVIDGSMTSVRVYKLPHSRLPPPLIKDDPVLEGITPPPSEPVRKIMRRRGIADASSEYGPDGERLPGASAGSGSDEDKAGQGSLDKSASTLKDREARYAETRARIFKDYQEKGGDASNGDVLNPDNELSRSSSTSGVKKGKKNRRPKDDSFEARSAYSQYGPQSFVPNDQHQQVPVDGYYNAVPGYPSYGGNGSQPVMPNQQPPQQWQAPQFVPQYAQGYQSPGQVQAEPYENVGGYQQYSSSFMATQTTPRPTSSYPATYHPQQLHPQANNWPNVAYPGNHMNMNVYPGDPNLIPPQMNQPIYTGQFGMPVSFGDPNFQTYGYQPQPYNHGQHFNPQIQSFVPGMPSPGPMYGYVNPPNTGYPPMQRQHSNISQASYQSNLNSPSASRHNGQSTGRPSPSSSRQGQPNLQSSISKWTPPSTLPAKPPPVASSLAFQPPKYSDVQQALPSHPFAVSSVVPGGPNASSINRI